MIVNAPKKHGEVEHNFKNRYVDSSELQKPTAEATSKSIKSARDKIDEILGVKKEASFGTNIQRLGTTTSEMVKFTAKGEEGSTKQRVARIDSVQIDPLAPPMHKHRKLPKGPGSPPPPLLRSPPRRLTQTDMANWKVPPCISNWKNSRGYTIPIHMRLAADGRSLQHNSINESFADIIDSLYVAERQSKLELEERAKIQRSVDYKQYLKKEEELRKAALEAREEFKKIQENDGD
jgi:SNW domain-containing protein 1